MTRTMYDSVQISAIPPEATMVGYYVDGRFANGTEAQVLFPRAILVGISALGSNDGVVGDVESGDLTPASSVDWVLMRRAAGVDPTIYMSLSVWQQVRDAFNHRGVPEPHYWVADYDMAAVLPAGAVAKQYADPAVHGGGNYDISIVADYWPGVDTGTTPDSEEEADLSTYTITRKDGTEDVFAVMPAPDRTMRHTVIRPDGSVLFNDILPGSWGPIIKARWNDAEYVLSVVAYGWQNGQGGSVWTIWWTAEDSAWHGPARVL